MGNQDIAALFAIKTQIKEISEKHTLSFAFKVDLGNYETAIEFVGDALFHPPLSKDWSTNPIILCPDLLDYHKKLIIEYEEEVGPKRTGTTLAKKGHHREGDYDNKRDARRNKFYSRGGFHVLRLWESDKDWKEKLENFLLSYVEPKVR